MPHYRVQRGTYRAEDGTLHEPGDTVELDAEFVAHFPDSKFERVDDDADDTDADGVDEAVDDYVEGHSDVDQLEEDLEDELSDSFEQAEELADSHWRTAQTAVENGEADDYLDELAQVEDRESVLSSIDDRRDELEG